MGDPFIEKMLFYSTKQKRKMRSLRIDWEPTENDQGPSSTLRNPLEGPKKPFKKMFDPIFPCGGWPPPIEPY